MYLLKIGAGSFLPNFVITSHRVFSISFLGSFKGRRREERENVEIFHVLGPRAIAVQRLQLSRDHKTVLANISCWHFARLMPPYAALLPDSLYSTTYSIKGSWKKVVENKMV